MAKRHFEPYLYLPALTCDAALVAWGGFYFELGAGSDDAWEIVDDEAIGRWRAEVIGARSASYGPATVHVFDRAGNRVATSTTRDKNHAWVRGLEPDREYRYEVIVDGKPWATGPRLDWSDDSRDAKRGRLAASGRAYENVFRTDPPPHQPSDLTFAVLGDYGVGIRGSSSSSQRQRRVAEALARAVELHSPRMLLTAGDNIYMPRSASPTQGSGDEDDDWFFTFYQPYRYVINRIPTYPCVGNHDTGETEDSDDREQLADNFFLRERFSSDSLEARASMSPGLFYSFRFGADVEFVCLDSSESSELSERYMFRAQAHRRFLEETFAREQERPAVWKIPFCHHPPYCAGPHHSNHQAMIDHLEPLFQQSGVRVVLSGHEHNFQYSEHAGIHYFISGAGARLREEPPRDIERAHTRAWAAEGHFLLVQTNRNEMTIRPIGAATQSVLSDIELRDPHTGSRFPTPIRIRR